MYFVYILKCSDGSLYTGQTNNIVRRIVLHNKKQGAKYTKSRLPATLYYRESVTDIGRALRRESRIKKMPRAKKLLLGENFDIISFADSLKEE